MPRDNGRNGTSLDFGSHEDRIRSLEENVSETVASLAAASVKIDSLGEIINVKLDAITDRLCEVGDRLKPLPERVVALEEAEKVRLGRKKLIHNAALPVILTALAAGLGKLGMMFWALLGH